MNNNDDYLFMVDRHFADLYDNLLSKSIYSTYSASNVTPEPTTFDLNELYKVLGKVPASKPRERKLISSVYSVRDTGRKTCKYIKLSFKQRWFSRPWKPLKKYRLILVPVYEPVIYKTRDMLIYHPSLWPQLRAAIENREEIRS